jgi:probable F420-dependent oxidoreductase
MAPDLGSVGIWLRHVQGSDAVPEIEALGFPTLWVGGSPSLEQVRPFLERSSELTVASGIVNVWRHDAAGVARTHAELRRDFGERFLLGVGIGHPESTDDYTRPLTKMRTYLDELDGADPPVPPEERLIAALGPKMLDLAAARTLGTHPYFTSVEHTRFARERVGPGVLVAPEVTVVVGTDAGEARDAAREFAARYLKLRNYADNLRRFGFSEEDVAGGASDRLLDAVVPHGSAEELAEVVRAHLDAGADHVCVQPIGHGPTPVDDYRALAAALL